MAEISKALKKLIENSDDLSSLPALVAKVEALEKSEEDYQNRIQRLQEVNKSYLSQIPIPGQEEPEDTKDPEPTLEDAKQYLIDSLGGKQ